MNDDSSCIRFDLVFEGGQTRVSWTSAGHGKQQRERQCSNMIETTSTAWSPEVWAAIITATGAVLSGAVGIGGAILGTKIGARANQAATLSAAGHLSQVERERFIAQRIWEERRRAYSAVLTNLSDARDLWSYIDDGFSEAGRAAEAFYQTDTYRDWRAEALKHWWEASRILNEDRLVLSESFVSRMATLRECIVASDFDHDPPNEAHDMRKAYREAFDDLLKISKADVLPSTQR